MKNPSPTLGKGLRKLIDFFGNEKISIDKKDLHPSKNIKEIELPFTTRVYSYKKENLLTRFDNAYFLFLEQLMKDEETFRKEDLK